MIEIRVGANVNPMVSSRVIVGFRVGVGVAVQWVRVRFGVWVIVGVRVGTGVRI